MSRKVGAIAVAVVAAGLAIVASATARPAATSAASCSSVQIGMSAPITGPAGSIGSDQLHWAQFYFTQWNKTHKQKITLKQFDDQIDPAKAATGAQSFASNSKVVGVIGPAGSDQVQAAAPIYKKAGLAFASGSATRVSLTNGKWKGFFFRDVPNDGVQGPTDAAYMTSTLGVKSGDTVMIVDDQESYSTGLADIVGSSLKAKGVTVDRESVSQKATDFSSLVAKVTSSVKVVFLPFQIASEAQLFAQQLKAQGKSAVVFGSDGTFDVSKFNPEGALISFFAPDVTTIKADAAIVKAFHKQFPGATSPFGAPNYVLAQMYAQAVTKACSDGKISRAEVRADVLKVKLSSSLIGPISLTAKGDVAGAKFHIFKVIKGKYVTIA
jgi:branched-chain amino acid transport system substrate-binding protein